ncbi:DUF4397 domain-containing protein [Mucilaginibacter gotjawali]|uniref:Uncharacterized protein n=2 Tax=Mucilaginibacter gotjawali TaxID=1550579 RepID=A0A110B4H3_9SPHI|nr:DUF4397 domain-containing protein [Mucilaginibacter gotjawali]MBB3055611.1 hypothetical protein [Mucilaginibacter gotjawali]BAU53105.1 hypothetical protein MgSA37_01272 [Mucilaginibacter gotjawali]
MIKRLYIVYFFAALLAFESCKNNDSVIKTVLYAGVNVVNASADTLNFYLNGTRQNNTSSLYPGSQSYYLPVPQGAENFQFKKAGTFNVLFSVPLTLKDSTNYSIYLAGETADNSFSTVDVLYPDTTPNKTQIRFVNASPDAGNLDAYVGDTLNYKTSAYKTSSAFFVTGSGIKNVKVYQTGSATPLIDTPITFQPKYIYSLVSRGKLTGTGSAKFSIGIVINYNGQ